MRWFMVIGAALMLGSALPKRAEKARTAGLHNALDPSAIRLAWTARAGLPFPAIDGEILLKAPNLAIGADVIAETRPARGNCLRQHGLDGWRQPCSPRPRHRMGGTAGRNAGAV